MLRSRGGLGAFLGGGGMFGGNGQFGDFATSQEGVIFLLLSPLPPFSALGGVAPTLTFYRSFENSL